MMGTEIFNFDASRAEKLTKTRVSFLMTPTVIVANQENNLYHIFWRELFLFLYCDFKLIYTTASLAIVRQTAGGQFMADKLPGKC